MKELSKAAEEALNIQGYGFQYSVAKLIEDLHAKDQSPWFITVIEFPVDVQNRGSRIDLVLKHRDQPLYICAECKRANPAYSDWFFAKSSYIHPVELARLAYVERVDEVKGSVFYTSLSSLVPTDDIYHVALEIKTDKKGDRYGSSKDQIEKASTQACVSANGLIELFQRNRDSFGRDHSVGFLPVIFTTANLYSSDVELSNADVSDGNIDLANSQFEEKDWIFFHYPQSSGIKHSVPASGKISSLRDTLYREYVRTIAIVSPSGIKSFLLSGVFR